MGAPLATVAVFNAMLFGTWGALERYVFLPAGDDGRMTPAQAGMAGCLAGIPVSLLATPTELLKCRLQQQAGKRPLPGHVFTAADYQAGRMLYRGPMDVLRGVVTYEGPAAVMRGLTPTLLREVPGALWFAEVLCHSEVRAWINIRNKYTQHNCNRTQIHRNCHPLGMHPLAQCRLRRRQRCLLCDL